MSEKTSIFALASESDIWWLKRGSGLFNCCQRVVKFLSRYPSVIKQLLEKFLVCSGGGDFGITAETWASEDEADPPDNNYLDPQRQHHG